MMGNTSSLISIYKYNKKEKEKEKKQNDTFTN